MTNDLKDIFDTIHAEEKLKGDTLRYLQVKIYKRKHRHTLVRRFTYAAAAALIFAGIFSYNLYFTPSAYIDVDVNPSIELSINRFDRVIDTHAYNSDGSEILTAVDITHKDYRDAVNILFTSLTQKGYSGTESYISLTLPISDSEKESVMLANIQSTVLQHHTVANVDTFSIDSHVRDAAHDLNLSPAKYLAIQELIKVNPNITIDSCRNHSIGEIHEMTNEHSGYHDHTSEKHE